jgi:hypothetical protein
MVPIPKRNTGLVSDIETAAMDGLKALDPKRPIREADMGRHLGITNGTILDPKRVILF